MEPIKGILKDVLGDLTKRQRAGDMEKALKIWKRVVGDKAYPHTKIVYLTKGRIRVNVDNSAWLFELNARKTRIARELGKSLGIGDVRLCLGDIS